MPLDALGEAIGAALEAAGEIALSGPPPERGRRRRRLYWSFLAVFVGLVFVVVLFTLN